MSPSRKRPGARGRKKPVARRAFTLPRPAPSRVIRTVLLVCFFLFSILVTCYVVFFRTVLAAEVEGEKPAAIIFEEPTAHAVVEAAVERTALDSPRPLIAIIIDDMGYNRKLGYQFLALEMNLSFSFLPFAPHTPELEEVAYKAGSTVLLHLPLQPKGKQWDPGPGALYLGKDETWVRKMFEKDLDAVPHAVGVNNHMGSLYTEDVAAMTSLLTMVKEKGLFFVDSFTTAKSISTDLATRAGIKTARRHVFLDNKIQEVEICKQLERLAEKAEEQGYGIGIGHPHPETLDALTKCMEKVTRRVKMVSVTELLY